MTIAISSKTLATFPSPSSASSSVPRGQGGQQQQQQQQQQLGQRSIALGSPERSGLSLALAWGASWLMAICGILLQAVVYSSQPVALFSISRHGGVRVRCG